KYRGGLITLDQWYFWQSRYNDVIREYLEQRGGDKIDQLRVRYEEASVQGLRAVEKQVRDLHEKGLGTETDLLMIKLSRLEAESALAKARSKLPKAKLKPGNQGPATVRILDPREYPAAGSLCAPHTKPLSDCLKRSPAPIPRPMPSAASGNTAPSSLNR